MPEISKTLNLLIILASIAIVFCIPLMNFGCSSSEYIPEKMDAPLLKKVHELEKQSQDAVIQFAGKTNQEINEEMRTELANTGITTESIIKDIFMASGNVESVKKVTLLDFVVNLELSKKLDLK